MHGYAWLHNLESPRPAHLQGRACIRAAEYLDASQVYEPSRPTDLQTHSLGVQASPDLETLRSAELSHTDMGILGQVWRPGDLVP